MKREARLALAEDGIDCLVPGCAGMAKLTAAFLRDFDVPGRAGDAEFAILLPDPGPAPDERVTELARNVADAISRDEALNEPTRVALAFGYAAHPEDGDDAETLLDRAREPRIRMV